MPYKVIITSQEIWDARSVHWEEHYQKRGQARLFDQEFSQRVLIACNLLPEPNLNMFGSVDDWNYTARRVVPYDTVQKALDQSGVSLEMLVKWYWSEANWKTFVSLFHDLPVPVPQYEMKYSDGYSQLFPLSYMVSSVKNRKKNPLLALPNVHTEEK